MAKPPVSLPRPTRPFGTYVYEFTPGERIQQAAHLHWSVQAFARYAEDGGLFDVITVDVSAATEQEAIARAMAIAERPYYRVQSVREICEEQEAK